jgi:glycosyltransferase involved in cell wall biosynthesis
MFFPRGGSAQVVRSLARQLPAQGWTPRIVSGSLTGHGDAHRFFAGLDVAATVDFDDAARAADPLAHDPPFHPSYEDRPGAPDRVFARVDDAGYEHQVATWSVALTRAGAREADVLHLHHLTPLNEAAARVAPGVPVLGHLHGTELLMLEEIAEGPPAGWDFAEAWWERMRGWAARCARIVVLADAQLDRVSDLLDVPAGQCLVLPNGFDPEMFHPDPSPGAAGEAGGRRLAHWRRHLVDAPQGWAPGRDAGSIAYAEEDLAVFAGDAPVLLYVGRFTKVKRIGLLVRALARARAEHGTTAPLVILGGHPGEWEGEHPLDAVRATGVHGVFLAGWHDHDRLPAFLAASDVLVLPSVREQFGQVLVEAMACGVPPVAVDAHGPATIVADGETGWLVPPDDEAALAAALAQATGDPAERTRRGANARAAALARYAWPSLAARLAACLDAAASTARHR